MLAIERTPQMSAALGRVVSTNADTNSPITRDHVGDEAARDDWQRVIDHKLIEWGWNTREFDEEGVEPPSREIVRLAIELAERLRDEGCPAPDSVVPDPNGGIVFERRENGLTEVFQVWDDGTVEYQQFQGTRLVCRDRRC